MSSGEGKGGGNRRAGLCPEQRFLIEPTVELNTKGRLFEQSLAVV